MKGRERGRDGRTDVGVCWSGYVSVGLTLSKQMGMILLISGGEVSVWHGQCGIGKESASFYSFPFNSFPAPVGLLADFFVWVCMVLALYHAVLVSVFVQCMFYSIWFAM